MSEPPKPRPWQRNRPRPRRPDVAVAGDRAPLATIAIYDDVTLLARRTALGAWRQYPVSPDALAETLSRRPQASGLLPRDTLGTGRVAGVPFLVTYVPPGVRTLRTPQRDYRIPLPPLVWAGCGEDYRLFALAAEDYPASHDLSLQKAPFPNCYADGRICWGDVEQRRPARADTLAATLTLFLEGSLFNSHLAQEKSVRYRASVLARWQALARRREPGGYPLGDLLPAGVTLGWLLRGAPWQ